MSIQAILQTGILSFALMLFSCNKDEDNDSNGGGGVNLPDVTVTFVATGAAEQELNYTNAENSSGDDNISALLDVEENELSILGVGQGDYMFIVKASSGNVPTAGAMTVLDGTYVNNLSDGPSQSFNDLETGNLMLTSVNFLYSTPVVRYYTISGTFEMQLTGDSGTVNITCTFNGLVVTAPQE